MSGLYRALLAKRDTLRDEGDSIAATAEAAGDYTDEQAARLEAIEAEMQRVNRGIQAEENRRSWERTAPADPVVSDGEGQASAPVGSAPTPFGSLGEQLRAVVGAAKTGRVADALWDINAHAAGIDRMAAATGAGEAIGFDGGFAVQDDFIPGILDRVFAGSQVAQFCDSREIGPGSNGVSYNVIDETSRADGSRGGGVQAYWIGEGGSLTASRPKLARKRLELSKLAALFYATDELLEDATALESWTNAEMQDEMAFKLDDAIIRGSGAGIPQGVLNADALVSVTKNTGQAAATFDLTNVKNMWIRMPSRSLGNAAWYINNEVWPQIFGLEQVVGTGGVPVYMPPTGAAGAPFGTLYGRPIRPIEQASALGTVGDVIFADFSRYLIIRKGQARRAVSMHVQFLTDEMAFRWILRINGRPKPHSALTPYKGAATTSPFVVLATRS